MKSTTNKTSRSKLIAFETLKISVCLRKKRLIVHSRKSDQIKVSWSCQDTGELPICARWPIAKCVLHSDRTKKRKVTHALIDHANGEIVLR